MCQEPKIDIVDFETTAFFSSVGTWINRCANRVLMGEKLSESLAL